MRQNWPGGGYPQSTRDENHDSHLRQLKSRRDECESKISQDFKMDRKHNAKIRKLEKIHGPVGTWSPQLCALVAFDHRNVEVKKK